MSHPFTNIETSTDLFSQTAREAAIDQVHAATALYTNDPIVLQLLDRIGWPEGGGALLDSSCGDGAFLGRALERLLAHEPDITDEDIVARLVAYEIHFFAASEARSRIKRVLIDHGRDTDSAESVASCVVRCTDFLTEGPRRGQFRAIVGNPPYMRMLHVPNPLRDEYYATVPDYAQADLLHSFLDRCANLLSSEGELAMVTADRWLINESAARLREVVGRYFGLAHVERLESTSAFHRPKLRRPGTPPRIHPVAIVLRTSGHSLQPIGRAPIYPDDPKATSNVTTQVLDDIANVRVAPWLGTRGIFLIDEARCRDWPTQCTVAAIDTDDIQDGVLRTPYRRALCTRPDMSPPPEMLAHLERELPRMCARGRSSIRWMPPEPFHRFDLTQPLIVVPRIARGVRPVRVPPAVLPVNHNLSIVWAGSLSLEEIDSILTSDATQTWIRDRAARLEHGYYSITTRLLRSLPLPDA